MKRCFLFKNQIILLATILKLSQTVFTYTSKTCTLSYLSKIYQIYQILGRRCRLRILLRSMITLFSPFGQSSNCFQAFHIIHNANVLKHKLVMRGQNVCKRLFHSTQCSDKLTIWAHALFFNLFHLHVGI
mgnify:CR=1 FL=1